MRIAGLLAIVACTPQPASQPTQRAASVATMSSVPAIDAPVIDASSPAIDASAQVAPAKPRTKNETVAAEVVEEGLRACRQRFPENNVELHGFVVLEREQTITDTSFDEASTGSAELKKCVRDHVVGVHPAIELGKMPMRVRF